MEGSKPAIKSGAEEFVPFLHQVVVFIRPLMPVGDSRRTLLERAPVPQIAFLDAALGRPLPGLALVPEGVFVGLHDFLDISRGRIVALFGYDRRRRPGKPIVGISNYGFLVRGARDRGYADRPGTVTFFGNSVGALFALRFH